MLPKCKKKKKKKQKYSYISTRQNCSHAAAAYRGSRGRERERQSAMLHSLFKIRLNTAVIKLPGHSRGVYHAFSTSFRIYAKKSLDDRPRATATKKEIVFCLTTEMSNVEWFLSLKKSYLFAGQKNINIEDQRDPPRGRGASLRETWRISFHVYKIISFCERKREKERERSRARGCGYYVTYISHGAMVGTPCEEWSPFENARGDPITTARGGARRARSVRYRRMKRKFDLNRRQPVSHISGNVRFYLK